MENSVLLIIAVVATILVALGLVSLLVTVCRLIKKEETKISFKEGLDLTELPIVTFTCGTEKLHFLLDTGSNISYIDSRVLSRISYQEESLASETIGLGGNKVKTIHYSITIGYKGQSFTEMFGAVDLSAPFETIKKENGVELHGILGSKFFEKYKYILDFKDLIAYK